MAIIDIEKIKQYFSAQPVSRAWLFGSFARGDASVNSDVDILVEFDNGVGLLKYASICSDLEHLLNKAVDLASDSSLLPWVRKSVDNEKILIYERKTS